MFIFIKSLNGEKKSIPVSRLEKIKNIKSVLVKLFNVPIEKQRLFFRGLELDDKFTLFDHKVNANDVIQLMIKESTNDGNKVENKAIKKDNRKIDQSKYYVVNEVVDANHPTLGCWLEAKILSIINDPDYSESGSNGSDGFLYDVQFFEGFEGTTIARNCTLSFKSIRPLAHRFISVNEVNVGDHIMVTYNRDCPNLRGHHYDCDVKEIKTSNGFRSIIGSIHIGLDGTTIEDCEIIFINDLMKVEIPSLLSDNVSPRNCDENISLRPTETVCTSCLDDPRMSKCKKCGCSVCRGKNDTDKQLVCDECQEATHLWCLEPVLDEIPEGDWYCPDCKNEDEVITTSVNLKISGKRNKVTPNKARKNWGGGMACVGRSATCTVVPSNHFGPIPGIEVGSSWKYRMQVAEAGVHRPPVAGIAGRAHEGAFSIVLSGGYEDDVDNGFEFLYTGSGGRDLKGNKRTSTQSCDQRLVAFNMALARNCNAKPNENGAEATDWKKGKPVRVIRNYKLARHSVYAPKEGNRYDGIYKVVKYYKVKGKSGFMVWRYLLRRDDPIDPPWTEEGKRRIKTLGLKMIYPPAETFSEASSKDRKRKEHESDSEEDAELVKKYKYALNESIDGKINEDVGNKKVWDECKKHLKTEKDFLKQVEESFTCVCCCDIVHKPVTIECSHNICLNCLDRSFKADIFVCPYCRHELGREYEMKVNQNLSEVLSGLFPGYAAERK